MRALLLDSHSLLFRAFHALPEMTTRAGEPTSALYGFSALLFKLLREERPDGVALARDLPGKTRRHERYPSYKAGRAAAPSALVRQLARFDELVRALGFPMLAHAGFEADDVLATLAARRTARGDRVVVVSGDRDLLQTVAPQCDVLFLGQRGKPPVRYDRSAVEKRFGIPPERLPGYVALVGDPADNIPKVKGIGGSTARQLMTRYASVAELLDDLPSIASPGLRALLASHAAQLRTSEELARLHRDLPLPEIEPAPFDAAARDRTRTLLEALEFKSLLPRLEALSEPSAGQGLAGRT
jgi:DNA polymerase I